MKPISVARMLLVLMLTIMLGVVPAIAQGPPTTPVTKITFPDNVVSVAIGSNGELYVGGERGGVYGYSAKRQVWAATKGHAGRVNTVKFAGQHVVTASDDGTVRIRAVEDLKPMYTLKSFGGQPVISLDTVQMPTFPQDKPEYLGVAASAKKVVLFRVSTGEEIWRFQHNGLRPTVRFVDSVRIAFATAKGDVTIFWLNGQIERTWEAHVSGLAALEVLSAECLLTAGGYFQSGDDAVKVWQKDYMQFDPSSCATALAGTTKGRRLTIAGCKDGTTRFYDENGSLVDEVMGNPHRLVSGLALDPSESRVAIANATRTLMIAPVPNWSINLK